MRRRQLLAGIALFASLSAVLHSGVAAQALQDGPEDKLLVRQLETDFASARQFEFAHRMNELPQDVSAKLIRFNRGFSIADLGSLWYSTEGRAPERSSATAQLIFSALSENLFFALLNTARRDFGPSEGVVLILGYRDSDWFCTYASGDIATWRLRIDNFQEDFSPSRVTPRQGSPCAVKSAGKDL